jgi:hypothetical protein
MGVHLAEKTLIEIERQVEADQGKRFRGFLEIVLPGMADAYRQGEDGHRSHMGASLIGGDCGRAIWYNFRWATKPRFSGRIIRLFNRGHLEEARFIALLLMMGCTVYQQDETGKQYRISHAEGHFGGSGDGVVIGLPDLPDTYTLTEWKTHGEKSFIELAGKDWKKYVEHLLDPKKPKVPFTGKGVRDAKFEHYVQMQVYMRKMGLPIGLYGAVNKNTDEIYLELVPLNVEIADQFLARAEKLIEMDVPPAKISETPGFYKCAYCDHKPVCHLKAAPDRNCRTCVFASVSKDATWVCGKFNQVIPKEVQLTGCQEYQRNPVI